MYKRIRKYLSVIALVFAILATVVPSYNAVAAEGETKVNVKEAAEESTDELEEETIEEKPVEETAEEDKAMGDSYMDDTIKLRSSSSSAPSAPDGTVATGIDISHHNGDIDFSKLSEEVDFVIIRCGYGQDYTSQDDKKFAEYVKGCVEYDIPFGVYLYSYATTTENASSEAAHTIRLLETLNDYDAELSLPVFYDMEDSTQASVSNSTKASIAKTYCTALEEEGYTVGIYANKSWWTNYLTDSYFDDAIKWVAEYNSTCTYSGNYSMWQCSSTASISGIGDDVDLDYMVEDIFLYKDISDATISSISDQVYTGDAIKPSITVKYNGTKLVKGTDYTISYSNNTNVGMATVKVTGKGSFFTGTKIITFNITARDISDAEMDSISAQEYTGNAIAPSVVMKYNGYTLTQGTDYTVDYSNNTEIGNAIVTITGKGNFKGTKTVTFTITDIIKSVADATVESIASKTYTGSAIKPSVTVKYDDVVLTKGTDYTLSYSNNTNVGTASVIITGKGDYSGTKKVTFSIKQRAISSATVSSISDKTYTGSALKPSPTVKYNSKTLTKGTDYTVSYSNNTNAGTATVAIKGKGNFSGTKKVTFKIKQRSISSATVTGISNKTYTGKSMKPTPTVKYNSKTLTKGTDYTVTYGTNKNPGKATVTIKGKGNFTGSVTKTFKILPKSVSIKSFTRGKNYLSVYYSASTGCTGYDIAYRVKGTSSWSHTGCSSKHTGCKITGLKSGKTYQVKVRPYITINGTKYYGSYSSVKTAKTK